MAPSLEKDSGGCLSAGLVSGEGGRVPFFVHPTRRGMRSSAGVTMSGGPGHLYISYNVTFVTSIGSSSAALSVEQAQNPIYSFFCPEATELTQLRSRQLAHERTSVRSTKLSVKAYPYIELQGLFSASGDLLTCPAASVLVFWANYWSGSSREFFKDFAASHSPWRCFYHHGETSFLKQRCNGDHCSNLPDIRLPSQRKCVSHSQHEERYFLLWPY